MLSVSAAAGRLRIVTGDLIRCDTARENRPSHANRIDTGALLVRRFTRQDVDHFTSHIESLPELSRWMWWLMKIMQSPKTATFIESQQDPESEGDEGGFGIFEKNQVVFWAAPA